MVDWERVEELRTKGWDWDRIADDSSVGYQAPRGVTDTGRALRSLYVRRARTASREEKTEKPKSSQRTDQKSRWTLARVGMLSTPLLAIWFLIAYSLPSPVGIFISAIPTLGLALAVAAFVLAFGLLRSEKKWSGPLRGALASGIILGLVVSAVVGIGGILAGFPTLTPITSAAPDNFHLAKNPVWTDTLTSSGKPVLFFFGSAACPYCSASSWAVVVALERFGSLTGTFFDTSSPSDVYPYTPETVLASAVLTSSYISFQVSETTYTGAVTLPGFGNEYQNAYYVAYDSTGSIPYIVIGGQYFAIGTLFSPMILAQLSPAQVQSQIAGQSGAAWSTAISPQADWLTAFLLKVDGGQPASILTQYPNVATDLAQIG
ncbi:MAG: DUF929 domain-containing protein [Thermoplasmata archaeon]|nr:DUF929 domain-containing protein [Thermoplasmata archaeon]